jgi:predicted nucleotidyltransferase
MAGMKEIRALSRRIAKEFDPERIILFGSYAYGNPSPHSDVDLLVIMDFEGKPFWKSLDILVRISPPFSTDILARRPGDTEKRYALGDPLIREAIDRGKVLYERSG